LASRYLNDGFSGGEKKQMEVLQMALLQPALAIMDETDSGLDLDKLQVIGEGAARLSQEHNISMLVITHYKRLLRYIQPSHVHLLLDGKIVVSSGPALVDELEEKGFDYIRDTYARKSA
jgi:Fe-S cluster assembly ATP-binding protein